MKVVSKQLQFQHQVVRIAALAAAEKFFDDRLEHLGAQRRVRLFTLAHQLGVQAIIVVRVVAILLP